MNQLKPYLIRAIYQWCCDNDLSPHIVVFVNEHTHVPMKYVQDNEIMLNISMSACQNIHIGDEWLSFDARFSGSIYNVLIPIGHVISIFARENGEGMGFEVSKYQPPENASIEKPLADTAKAKPKAKPSTQKSTHLKVVKKKAD